MPEVINTEIGPDDTLDGDYGRLLEQATAIYVKWDSSPTGFATRWSLDFRGLQRDRTSCCGPRSQAASRCGVPNQTRGLR